MKNIFKITAVGFLLVASLGSCGGNNSDVNIDRMVTFDPANGEATTSITTKDNSSINKPTIDPVKEDHYFLFWSTTNDNTSYQNEFIFNDDQRTASVVTRDITLYAQYDYSQDGYVRIEGTTISWADRATIYYDETYEILCDGVLLVNELPRKGTYTFNPAELGIDDGNIKNFSVFKSGFSSRYLVGSALFRSNTTKTKINNPENFRVENNELKWDWLYSFAPTSGFNVFIDGRQQETQFATRLSLRRFTDGIDTTKDFDIMVYALGDNDTIIDSEMVLFNYKYVVQNYDVKLDYLYSGRIETTKTTNGVVNLPNPTRSGYVFLGWYASNDNGVTLNEEWSAWRKVYQEMTLYADWTEDVSVAGLSVMPTPSLSVNGAYIKWNNVIGATAGYNVQISYSGSPTENFSTNNTSLYINFGGSNSVTVRVQTKGDGITSVNSSWATRVVSATASAASVKLETNINTGVWFWSDSLGGGGIELRIRNSSTAVLTTSTSLPEFPFPPSLDAGEYDLYINNIKFQVVKLRLATVADFSHYFDETMLTAFISFSPVAHASRYEITVDGTMTSQTTTSYNFPYFANDEVINISITAFDDNADYFLSFALTQKIRTPLPKPSSMTIVSETGFNSVRANESLQLLTTTLPIKSDSSATWEVVQGGDCGSITSGGLFQGLKIGNTTIRATSTIVTSVKADIVISVTEPVPTSVSITSISGSSEIVMDYHGSSMLDLLADVHPSEAVKTVTWSIISGPDVISLQDSSIAPADVGKRITVKALKGGIAVVRASSTVAETIYSDFAVTVDPNAPTSLTIVSARPNNSVIPKGDIIFLPYGIKYRLSNSYGFTDTFRVETTPSSAVPSVEWSVTQPVQGVRTEMMGIDLHVTTFAADSGTFGVSSVSEGGVLVIRATSIVDKQVYAEFSINIRPAPVITDIDFHLIYSGGVPPALVPGGRIFIRLINNPPTYYDAVVRYEVISPGNESYFKLLDPLISDGGAIDLAIMSNCPVGTAFKIRASTYSSSSTAPIEKGFVVA